jgi:outer membrane protein
MKNLTILILAVIMAVSAQTITLKQAQDSALEKNYGYALAKENLNYSELTAKNSFAAFLPTASLSATYILYAPEVEMSSFKFIPPSTLAPVTMTQEDRMAFGLRITQPLFSGGKILNSYRISKDSENMSRNTLNSEMLKLMADVESQYLSLLEAKEMFSIAKESLELSKKNGETAKIKYDSGLIPKADYLKSSSASAASEVGLFNAEKTYELAKMNFSNLTGIEESEPEPVGYEKYEPFILKLLAAGYKDADEKLGELEEIAKKNNGDLKNISLSRDINEKKISISKGNFMPGISLSYSTEWAKSNLADEYSNSGTIALSASIPVLPLYDNLATLEKSRIDLKKTELLEDQLIENLSFQIRSHLYTIISASRQLSSSKAAAEVAEEAYYSIEQRANSGLSTEDELNAARLSLTQAKFNKASAYFTILKTKSGLMKLLGISDEEEILKLF